MENSEQSNPRKRITREEYLANPKHCEQCGERIPFENRRGKFCSHTCSAAVSNRTRQRETKRSRVCSCGKPKLLANKYCYDCAYNHVYHKPKTFEEIKDHVSRKKFLIAERGHRCQDEDCLRTEWKKGQPIPLDLHHINGDSDDNRRENLLLLCPNCHTFTEHYKGAVKGKNGSRQIRRRKKYADGEAW